MEINKAISKEALKWKCRQHPKYPCELICLDGDTKDRVMCLICAQKQLIPLSKVLSMSLVLNANEQDILEAYPPLQDQDLYERLRKSCLEQQLEEIEVYFKKLREDIEKEVQAAEQRSKETLIKQGQDKKELLERYRNIAEIEKLKKLIVSEKESAEKDLDSFIKEKWSKAEENSQIIEDLMDQYEFKYNFSSDEPNKIVQETIERLKSINFFQQKIAYKLDLIKSTFGNSQSIAITKVNDFIYQLKQQDFSGQWGQVFINPILDPLQKYILNIELEIQPGNLGYLDFGLMKDEGKDNNCGQNQYMCYQDNNKSFGFSKQIKGNPMQQKGKIGKHRFEVRIHLNEKYIRVASLPDYSSIVELDNPNKIDPKVAYRFFFAMYEQGDMIRIYKFKRVSKYDEKM